MLTGIARAQRSAFLAAAGMCFNGPDGGGGGSGAPADSPTLTWTQAVNRAREIEAEVTRLSELKELSDDDEKYLRSLSAEFDMVDGHRKRLERDAELARIRSAVGAIDVRSGTTRPTPATPPGDQGDYDRDAFLEPDSVADQRFRDPWNIRDIRTFGRTREDLTSELTSRARSAIDQMPQANDKIRAAATTILEEFDDKEGSLARHILASSSPAYLRAFSKLAQDSGHLLTDEEKNAVNQVRAMSLTSADGGYLVPFQLDPTVILTANGSRNDIRQIARQVVATGNKWNGVSSGAVSWSWDAESTTATAVQVSDDSTTFAQPSVDIFKAQGFVPISLEALEDEQNVGAAVATLLAQGREILEAAAFITGTGTGQPKGIVTALVGTGAVTNSATTDTLAVADLYTVQGALPARFRANAAWLANNLFYNKARQFDTAGGSALWAQLAADRPPLLLGRGVYEAEDMDGTITGSAENYMAIFGDFENFVIADRIGMTVEFIPHLFQQTTAGAGAGRPTGQRGWFAHYRVGSNCVNSGAFKMLDVT